MTRLHFVDVGQGNMTILEADDGLVLVYDCNITDENEARVIAYAKATIGSRRIYFMNSHRDADHMRGLEKLHSNFGIRTILDCGECGNTPDSSEYETYMRVGREVGRLTVRTGGAVVLGRTRLTVLNSGDNLCAWDDSNAGSVVLAVEHATSYGPLRAILSGDSDGQTWRDSIMRRFGKDALRADILLAGHHGSDSFVEDENGMYYVDHLAAMNPAVTVVSVGDNSYGHPDLLALRWFRIYSRGDDITKTGIKVVRTDERGSMSVDFLESQTQAYWWLRWEREPVRAPPSLSRGLWNR